MLFRKLSRRGGWMSVSRRRLVQSMSCQLAHGFLNFFPFHFFPVVVFLIFFFFYFFSDFSQIRIF